MFYLHDDKNKQKNSAKWQKPQWFKFEASTAFAIPKYWLFSGILASLVSTAATAETGRTAATCMEASLWLVSAFG